MASKYQNAYLTRNQVAEYLSCSVKHVYRLDRNGALKRHFLPNSKRPRYAKADVEKLMR